MIALFFIIILELSVILHVYYMVSFISKKDNRYFRGFFITAVINIFMSIFIAVFVITFPSQLRQINLEMFLFIQSGIIFIIMLYIKMKITTAIYRRAKDPENFHYNVFGKKVLHKNVTTPKDVMLYFMTLPITLFCGAYFVVKLGCLK